MLEAGFACYPKLEPDSKSMMKTKLTLFVTVLAATLFGMGCASPTASSSTSGSSENFDWKFAFSEEQLKGLGKIDFKWSDELIPNGDMQTTAKGFHDSYGNAEPIKIVKNQETEINDLVVKNRKALAEFFTRVFFNPSAGLAAGDIILMQYTYLDNLKDKKDRLGGGPWASSTVISKGRYNKRGFHNSYIHRYLLFQVDERNERGDKLHLGMGGSNVSEGLRIAYWSARKLITEDTDGDGKNDAQEILITGTLPRIPNKFEPSPPSSGQFTK